MIPEGIWEYAVLYGAEQTDGEGDDYQYTKSESEKCGVSFKKGKGAPHAGGVFSRRAKAV